jgi:16S rRNA processing protein RimM
MPFQDQDQSPSRVCIGKIASAHGVKGLVKVLPFTKEIHLLGRVFIDETSSKTLDLTIKNPLGKYFLAEIKGITDRNGAEALGKCSFFVDRDIAAKADPHVSVIGLQAINAEGTSIGTVSSVENYGAGDLLEIRLKTGKSILVPLNKDFVLKIEETVTVVNYEAFL